MTGMTDSGLAYFRCEKCGEYEEDFPGHDGKTQEERLAKVALRLHMLGTHNTGD